MKRLSIIIFLAFSICSFSQPLLQKQAITLKRVIEKNHYAPKTVDNSFSAEVFNSIIDILDDDKIYFTEKNLTELSSFKEKIDDELNNKGWGFVPALAKIYTAQTLKTDSILKKILASPLTFSADEIYTNAPNEPYATNDAALIQRLTLFAKNMVLYQMFKKYKNDSLPTPKATILKTEPEARKEILKILSEEENETYEENLKNIGQIYLNTIAETFDPHTSYLPPEEKDDFENELNSEQQVFGFQLEKDDKGKLKVESILPGSSAWKTGNVHKDDELLEITNESGKSIQVSSDNTKEVEKFIDENTGEKIILTLRSADGTIKTVPLQKESIQNEDNIVKGFVLSGLKKAGYIKLPSFYTQWDEQATGTSCANDIAQEIVKLKRENIDGLILDLRYNGGGSVQEALDLSGIFIDAGPICAVRDNDKNTVVIKDQNRGTIYDGPLIVMINGQSASASELVASSLQDYNRALIVGSPSFGKATMQVIIPIDSTAKDFMPTPLSKDYGFVKTTTGKLFRVNGNTAQLNGVIPHIDLPDAFTIMNYTERKMKHALTADTIMKKIYYTPLKAFNYNTLKQSSEQRLKTNNYFSSLKTFIEKAKVLNAQTSVPIKFENFEKVITNTNSVEQSLFKTQISSTTQFKVLTSAFDNKVNTINTYKQEINEYVIKQIEKDKYIEETYFILLDLINLK